MKAFVSYSLNSTEKYILSLLSMNLKENGINTVSSYSSKIGPIYSSDNQIRACQFFIGIISFKGLNKKKVLEEWKAARNSKIPGLLLIEDRVKITSGSANSPTVVRFNRNKPEEAIEIVNANIKQASKKIGTKKVVKNDNTASWVLGGTALLLLLGLLSSDDKK